MPSTKRLSQMSFELGDEEIDLERIQASEHLSAPFLIHVDVIGKLEVDFYPHLGKPCGLTIYEDDALLRQFNGLVTSAEYLRESTTGHHYRLTLRPWTYFLDQNREMAIYQEKTAVDIISAVLQGAGVSDFRLALRRARDVRGYCVQYQESDFAFISRLMEEEGIYYFFEHSDNAHVMVLCDEPGAHKVSSIGTFQHNPSAGTVFGVDSPERSSDGKYFLYNWGERVHTGGETTVTLRDFDFTSPDSPVKGTASERGAHPWDGREVFHYPGNFAHEKMERGKQEVFGSDRSKALLKGFRAQRRVLTGSAQSSGLACGTKVTVESHPTGRMNGQFLVTATHHSITAEKYRSGTGGSEETYNVRFEAIPAATVFQPPQITPRPEVKGLESAIVTGPTGEEIYTDEYGRVKVQFHWDRKGKKDEKSTCWIRVSQTGGLGNIILPRVGHEVLIDFLHGDPDRPVVVGRVFNQTHMPTYPLPEHKTKALWRTKRYGATGSYPNTKALDTGAPGVNELRFEDKGGSEEVFLHAERNMNTRIRFDETHHVGHNQDILIGYDRNEEVIHDETTKIGNDRTEKVTGEEKLEVSKNRTTKISMQDKNDVGTKYLLTANQSITLKCGASTIEIKPGSIELNSPQIKITGVATAKMSAPMTNVEASGILTLKGSLTLIN